MHTFLCYIRAFRRVEPNELQDILLHLDKEAGDQIWLLGTKGSRRHVENLNEFNPDRWQRFAHSGLVYVSWETQWAFAHELDPATKLPVRLESYEEVYRKRLAPVDKPAEPAPAPHLFEQPAAQATTPTTA